MSRIFTIEDEVNFWGLQVKEHMMFIHQGLIDDEVKKISKINMNGNLVNLKDQSMILYYLWDDILNKEIDVDNIIVSIDKTQNYQLIIQNLIKNGTMVSWLSYSFLEHLIMELNYFLNKITNSNYDLKDEIKFWLWHHQSEFSAAEKLLDPSEEDLSITLKQYIEHVKILETDSLLLTKKKQVSLNKLNPYTLEVLSEYINYTNSLKDGIDTATILSSISPILINHVIREGERAITIFNNLNQI